MVAEHNSGVVAEDNSGVVAEDNSGVVFENNSIVFESFVEPGKILVASILK